MARGVIALDFLYIHEWKVVTYLKYYLLSIVNQRKYDEMIFKPWDIAAMTSALDISTRAVSLTFPFR